MTNIFFCQRTKVYEDKKLDEVSKRSAANEVETGCRYLEYAKKNRWEAPAVFKSVSAGSIEPAEAPTEVVR